MSLLRRALFLAVASLITITSFGLIPPGAVAEPEPSAPSTPADERGAPPAVRTDPLEIVERRTETSKTFRTDEPGSFRTRIHSRAVHRKNEHGRWVDVDAALVDGGNGQLRSRSTSAAVHLAAAPGQSTLGRVDFKPGRGVDFTLAGGRINAPRVKGSEAIYEDVFPGVDLRYDVNNAGVKEDIVLASPSAPDTYDFPLRLRGVEAELNDAGDVLYRDADGTILGSTAHGYMVDSKYPEAGEGELSLGVTYELVDGPGPHPTLRVKADRAWLDDPARVYPVRIDPSFQSWTPEDDTYVMRNFTRDNAGDPELKVGTYDGGAHIGISFMHFDVGALNNKNINAATFHAFNFHSWSCNARGMGVYRVTQGWGGHTMTGYPGATTSEQVAWAPFAMGYSASCPGGWASFNVQNTVHNWTHGIWSPVGLAMKVDSVSEGDNYAWKKFNSWNTCGGGTCIPHIDVTWSDPATVPGTPASASATANTNGTATVNWTAPASNGGAAIDQYAINRYNASTGAYLGQTIACASCRSANIGGLSMGTSYYFRVYAHNSVGYGNYRQTNTITASTTPSAPQSVSATQDGTTATVKWSAPSTTNGASINQYAINVHNASTGAYTGQQIIACATCREAPVPNLSSTTTYYFEVYAHNMNGYGPSARTNNVPIVPAAPGQPTAVPTYAAAEVSWPRPVYDGGRSITSYTVHATDTTTNTALTPRACTGTCVTTRQMTFTGLTPGRSYTFRVTATNPVGTSAMSPTSSTITAEPTQTLAPTNVFAVRGDRQATVSWTAPSLSVNGLTEYTIYTYRAADNVRLQSTNAGTATSNCGATPAPCYVVTGLKNGTPVYFRVTSRNTIVESPESNPSNTVTPAGRPFAPVDVTAAPRDRAALVSWSPPPARADGTPGDNGEAITGYTVTGYRASDNAVVGTMDASSSPALFGNLVNGEQYYFRVHARNAIGDGDLSAASNVVTPVGPPSAPTGVTASARPAGAHVTWNPSNPNGASQVNYAINAYQSSDNAFVSTTPAGTATNGTVGGLVNGRRYYFTVTASSVGGSATSTASNSVIPSDIPGAPTNVRVELTEAGEALVTWTQPSSNGSMITKYIVRASNGAVIEAPWNSNDAELSVVFTGLQPGTTYTFTVAAVNNNGEGPAVQAAGSVSPISRPSPPTNAQVSESGTQATITWTASQTHGTPVTGYTVVALSAIDGSTVAATAGPNATSMTMTGLTAGPYTYSIWADSSYGPSESVEVAGGLPAPILVALGDSYSSGEGVPGFMPPSDSNGCHRSYDAYSQQYAAGTPFRSIFLACSGGVIANVDDTEQHDGDTPNGQLSRLPANANMITMTIGGNDAKFSDIVKECIAAYFVNRYIDSQHQGFGSPDHVYCEDTWMREDDPSHHEPTVIASIKPRLVELYKKIANAAPNAEIFVLNYPDLVASTGRDSDCRHDFMEMQDIEWIEEMQVLFGDMIRGAINDAKATIGDRLHLVDVQPTMDGHEVCTPEEWINGLSLGASSCCTPPKLSPVFSFHPKKAGHTAQANLLRAAAVLRRPTVTSVSPSSGPSHPSVCANQVTIRGTNFAPGSTVLFGGVPASSVQYVSASELRAAPPRLAEGTVDVVVRTNHGLNWGQTTPNSSSRFSYVRDTIAPTTSPTVTPGPNAAGWNRTNPTITLNATDQTCPNDVASITYAAAGQNGGGQNIPSTTVQGNQASFAITAEGTTIISYRAMDSSGNLEGTKQLTIKLDKTAPTNVSVSPSRAPDRNGWYNRSFSATWSGQDSLSGISGCTTRTYSGPDTATGLITGTCTDVAGNVSSAVGFSFKYDATAPANVRGVPSRTPDRNGWYNHAVDINFTGNDPTSGIESCTSTTYSGPDSASASVSGSCTDVAGNTASATFGLKYDATPATTTIDGDAVQVVVAGTPLTGTASDNLSGVDVTTVTFTPAVGDPVVRQATCTSGCAAGSLSRAWSVSTTGLTGVYTVTASTLDVAGNAGTPSNTVTVTVVG